MLCKPNYEGTCGAQLTEGALGTFPYIARYLLPCILGTYIPTCQGLTGLLCKLTFQSHKCWQCTSFLFADDFKFWLVGNLQSNLRSLPLDVAVCLELAIHGLSRQFHLLMNGHGQLLVDSFTIVNLSSLGKCFLLVHRIHHRYRLQPLSHVLNDAVLESTCTSDQLVVVQICPQSMMPESSLMCLLRLRQRQCFEARGTSKLIINCWLLTLQDGRRNLQISMGHLCRQQVIYCLRYTLALSPTCLLCRHTE